MSHRFTASRNRCAVLAAAVSLSACVSLASADNFVWNGATGSFSDPTQWAGGVVPTGLNAQDVFTFGGAGGYTATNDIGITPSRPAFYFGGLTLNTAGGQSVILPGGTAPAALRVTATSTINMNGAGTFVVAPVINIGAGATLNVNVAPGAGTLYLANTSTPTTLAADAFTGQGNVVVNNQSSNAVMIGNLGALSGDLTVSAGVVRAADGTNVPTLDGGVASRGGDTIANQTLITVAAGATFDFNGNGETMGGIAGAGTIQIGPTGNIGLNYKNDATFDGQIVPNGGTGTVTKANNSGNSVYTWGGNNTYLGNTLIESGQITLARGGRMSATPQVTVWSGATLRLDNTEQNVADRINPAANLVLLGNLDLIGAPGQASTQQLATITPQNNQSGGSVNINVVNGSGGGTATLTVGQLTRTTRSGTVNFTGDGSVIISSPVVTNGILGGWAVVNGTDWAAVDGSNKVIAYTGYQTSADPTTWAATDNVKVSGPLQGNLDATQSTINTLVLASADPVAIGTSLTLSGGGVIATESTSINGPGTISAAMPGATNTSDITFFVTAGKTLSLNASISSTPQNGLVKAGDGTLALAASNSYTADTRILGGTLVVPAAASLGTGANLRLNNNSTVRFTSAMTISKALRLDGAGGTVDTGANDVTFDRVVANNGILTKVGSGTMILVNSATANSGLLSGTSDVNIVEGGLRLGQGNTLDNGTLVNIAAGAFLDLSLDSDGEDSAGVVGAGELRIRTDGNTQWAGGQNRNMTFSGTIVAYSGGAPAAGGNVGKTGLGTLTLSGASKYTGTTTVSQGELILGADSQPNVDGPFGNSATAVLVGPTGLTSLNNAGLYIGPAGVTLGRDVTVQANATTLGVPSIGAKHTSGTSTFSGTITLNRGTELDVAGGGTTRLTGVVTGSGGLIKVGAGTAVLAGANTYTGTTTVQAGTLTVDGTQPNSNITIAPGATLNGTGTLTFNLAGDIGDLFTNSGTLNISGLDLSLSVTGTQTLTEYVIANNAGGTLVGTEFASVTGLPTGMTLDYDGTTAHPDSIVLTFGSVQVPGDADGDGDVDLDDQGIWASNFTGSLTPGTGTGTFGQGDFDGDKDIDLDDQGIWASNFTGSLAPSGLASVPEPASLAVLGLGAVGLVGRRRRLT